MQITVKREAFIEALEKVKPAVRNKATLPVITYYLVKAVNNKIVIIGTDLSFSLIADCPGKVGKEGDVLLPARAIAMLKSLTTPEVIVEKVTKIEHYEDIKTHWNEETKKLDTTRTPATRRHYSLQVTSGTSTLSFESKDTKDFPPIPTPPDKYPIRFSDLPGTLGQVIYAAAGDDNRPVLNGVCLHKGKKMEAAACDGFRLAVTPLRMTGTLDDSLVIPLEVAAILWKYTGPINLAITPKEGSYPIAFFSQKGLTLITNLRTDKFPDYEQLIPKTGSLITCAAEPLRSALKQVKALGPNNDKVILQMKGSNLLLRATRDSDKIEIKVPAKGRGYTGFDFHFLQQLLDHMDGTFKLKVPDDRKAAIAKIGDTTHLLMPMEIEKTKEIRNPAPVAVPAQV